MSAPRRALPAVDQRAALLARLDLFGGRYAGVTPEDRADAADVELPHLWEAIAAHADAPRYVCRTCGGRIADCTGNRRQARDALLARTRGAKARPDVHLGGGKTMPADTYAAAEAARQAAVTRHPETHAARQARLTATVRL